MEVMTIADVQKALRIGRCLAYQLIRRGQLPAVRLGQKGRVIRVPRAAVEELLRSALAPESGEARGEVQTRR
jgi:excisionase family DNA binding protein